MGQKNFWCDNASKKLRYLEKFKFLKLDVIEFQNEFWIPDFFNIPHNFFFYTFSGAFFKRKIILIFQQNASADWEKNIIHISFIS